MWNDPTAQIEGTFGMSNELFWNQWLLPILQDLNKATQFYTTQMQVEVDGTEGSVYFNWLVGQHPDPPESSTFRYNNSVPNAPGAFGYGWGPKEVEVSNEGEDFFFRIEAEQYGRRVQGSRCTEFYQSANSFTGQNMNRVRFMPSSQEIVVSGSGRASCRMDLVRTTTPPWPTYTK